MKTRKPTKSRKARTATAKAVACSAWLAELEAERSISEELMEYFERKGNAAKVEYWRGARDGLQHAIEARRRHSASSDYANRDGVLEA